MASQEHNHGKTMTITSQRLVTHTIGLFQLSSTNLHSKNWKKKKNFIEKGHIFGHKNEHIDLGIFDLACLIISGNFWLGLNRHWNTRPVFLNAPKLRLCSNAREVFHCSWRAPQTSFRELVISQIVCPSVVYCEKLDDVSASQTQRHHLISNTKYVVGWSMLLTFAKIRYHNYSFRELSKCC